MKLVKKIILSLYRKIKAWDKQDVYSNFRIKYRISESFKFNGNNIIFYGKGDIIIGNNSYIGSNSTIQAAEDCQVKIGSNCAISHNVRIYTTSVVPDHNWAKNKKTSISKNVIIEDYVWIGTNVFINPGIKIGENAVVGANSVVTRDVLPYSIVGGVPAKMIRMKEIKDENIDSMNI